MQVRGSPGLGPDAGRGSAPGVAVAALPAPSPPRLPPRARAARRPSRRYKVSKRQPIPEGPARRPAPTRALPAPRCAPQVGSGDRRAKGGVGPPRGSTDVAPLARPSVSSELRSGPGPSIGGCRAKRAKQSRTVVAEEAVAWTHPRSCPGSGAPPSSRHSKARAQSQKPQEGTKDTAPLCGARKGLPKVTPPLPRQSRCLAGGECRPPVGTPSLQPSGTNKTQLSICIVCRAGGRGGVVAGNVLEMWTKGLEAGFSVGLNFGRTPGSVQELLTAWCSGIIPPGAQGAICGGLGSESQTSACEDCT